MVITIDGPAGTGKSTAALLVAQRLKFDFLDTGAMYRAIGLAALRRQIDLNDPRALAFEARHARIEFDWSKMPPGVMLNGEPVGHLLRGVDATRAASYVAAVPAIREMLVEQQRKIGSDRKNVVTEGRDQGTVVFPTADHKFYLDATPAERAKRRCAQLRSRGETVDFHQILHEIEARDLRDRSRTIGPLAVPKDAEIVDTTTMTEGQVVDYIVDRVRGMVAS
jgi:cytidylate kinase